MSGLDASYDLNTIVENIGRLSPDLLAETCQHILSYLQGQAQGVDSAEISDLFHRNGVSLHQKALQNIIKFLLLTFRSAGRSSLSGDDLESSLQQGSSTWPPASLQVVLRLWGEQGALVCAHQETQAMLSTDQLVDMQWKLAMAVSSDTCRSLTSPYVTLLLKMADPSGRIYQRSVEMTIPQFQNLHRQFKEIAAVLETV